MFILDMNGCGHYYFTVRCCEGALTYTHRYKGESLIFSMIGVQYLPSPLSAMRISWEEAGRFYLLRRLGQGI